jgi:hypothetical protein
LETEGVVNTFGGNWLIRVKEYDNGTWTQVGQTLNRNTENNEEHVDFLINTQGSMFIGMKDTIFQFNESTSLWESTYVPYYYGGLSEDSEGNIYFLHRMPGVTSTAHSDIDLAKFSNGTITILNNIAIDLPAIPRKINASNQILFRGNQIYVSFVTQSSNNLVVFRGSFEEDFTKLESASIGVSSLFAGLGLASMEVSASGEIVISRKSDIGNAILLNKYDEINDTWGLFDTTGIHSVSCNVNRLKYDKNGVLHLIYNGSNDKGFLFKFNGTSWEHIGPKSFFSYNTIASLNKPWITFNANNELYFSRGLGNSTIPLQVFAYQDENASIKDLNNTFISVFPNPSIDKIYIHGIPLNASVEIYSLLGQKIFHAENITNETFEVSSNGFKSGVYVLKIENESFTLSKQVVIQH